MRLDEITTNAYTWHEINKYMPGKRKQIFTAWKAARKVQLSNSRKAKAIRIIKAEKEASE